MSFTLFDIVVFSIIAISSLHGLYRGIIKLILSSVSFLTSILLAMYMYPFLNEMLAKYTENEGIKTIFSGILAYTLSSIIFSFIMSKLGSTLYQLTSNFSDKILGLVGGIIRGCVVVLAIFLAISSFYSGSYKQAENLDELIAHSINKSKHPKWLTNSISYEYLYESAQSVKNNMPTQYFKSIKLHKKKYGINNDPDKIDEMDDLHLEDF